MTYLLNIPDHRASHFPPTEETEWPAFNDRQEYCGQIQLISAWAVPARVYQDLELPNHLDLYLSTEGHWASTLERLNVPNAPKMYKYVSNPC